MKFSFFINCVACELHPAYPKEVEIDEVEMQLPFCVYCIFELAEIIDAHNAMDGR